mgnify:CR=1 FL=1
MLHLLDFPLPSNDISLAYVTGIAVLLVLFGGLVPRWMHNQRVKDKEAQNEILRAIIEKRDEQHEKLVDKVGVVIQLLEDIKRDGRGGGRHRTDDER